MTFTIYRQIISIKECVKMFHIHSKFWKKENKGEEVKTTNDFSL